MKKIAVSSVNRPNVLTAIVVLAITAAAGCSSPASHPADIIDDTNVTDLPDAAGDVIDTQDARDTLDSPDTQDVHDVQDTAVITDIIDTESDTPDATPVDWWVELTPSGLPLNSIVGIASQMSTNAAPNDQRDFEYQQYAPFPGFRMRNGHRFDDVERVQGVWDWDRVRGSVEGAVAGGSKVLMGLDYSVDWAQDGPDLIGTVHIDDFAEYAGAMAGHFCETVKEYEIWNEPNVQIFWKPEPDPERYADLVIASYTAIKAACPDAKVAFGALASFGPPNIFNTWNFLDTALAARPGLCDSFDVLSLHPYTWLQEVSAEHDEWLDFESTINSQTAMVRIARQMLADAGCQPKPIWFTEVGWPSYQLSEEKVALFAIRSFLLTAMDGVDAWCWYTFWDREPTDEGIRPHENYFGTFGWPGEDGTVRRAKPSWNAIVATLTRIGTFRYAGSLAGSLGLPDDVYVLAFANESGDIVLAGWDGRDMPDITSGGTATGGESTSFEIDIPLPADITGTVLYDIYGVETASETATPAAHMTLTPSVQLLVLEK